MYVYIYIFLPIKCHESRKLWIVRVYCMAPYYHIVVIIEGLHVQNCDVNMAHFPALDAKHLSCIDNPSLTLFPW